jgi:serine/threonine protein kinase/Tol biopolymer transport system component
MTPEYWRQIEDLYHAAQARPPGERVALLEGTDPEIRARVERMLALDSDGQILDSPAAGLLNASTETIVLAGVQLGPYQIEAPIGAGGMGTVYRAVDTRLGRVVAIKIAAAHLSERFQLEARAISTLNHPHICTLYDVGPDYLVMELLEGQTLKDRIAAGRFSNQELCSIAIPVCEALEAAHSRGIVHRDIKPGNIFITNKGIVKILDFGLAKTIGAESNAEAEKDTLTTPGTAVGTVSYMSPEQARGTPVDARTDLFSFGVVLYEMATSRQPFSGSSWTNICDALLHQDPPPATELNPNLAPELARIIERALQKDRNLRYQTASDLLADLAAAHQQLEPGVAALPNAAPRPTYRYLFAIVLALVAILAIVGVRWFYSAKTPVTNPAEYVQLTNFTDSATAPSLSPDGRMVTFIRGGEWFLSRGQIYVKVLPNGDAVRLSDNPLPKYGPVFTPDGSHIAYTQWLRVGDKISWDTMTVPVVGGQSTRFLPNASGLSWIDDHHVLFSEIKTGVHTGIVTATENRAESREIYFPAHERGMAHYSYLSPNHKWLLIVEMNGVAKFQQCRLTPFDGSSAGGPVGPQGVCTSAGWSPDGKWMYFGARVGAGEHLWRQRFPDGKPEQITFGTTEEEGVAVAPDGRSIVTALGVRQSAVWIHDPSGDRSISSEGYAFDPQFSADGKRVYYLLGRGTALAADELYSMDLASGTIDRPLPGVSLRSYDLSHDGKRIAFTKGEGTDSEIWLAQADRSSAPRLITRGGDEVLFGPPGTLIFRSLGQTVNYLSRIQEDGSGRRQIFDTPLLDVSAASPDGAWVVGSLRQVAPNSLPDTVALPVDGGTPREICNAACDGAGWSPDGRFFYVTLTGKTLAIPIPPGRPMPDFPPEGIGTGALPGAREIPRSNLFPGPDPSTYVFTEKQLQRNLFRIPLH